MSTKPKVISYLRFSSDPQKLGDSEQRQLEKAREWAKRNGLTLDETFIDRGVSAHRGKNVSVGQLGRLLDRISVGELPKGTIILIENIDRLSRRKPRKAFSLINTIIEKGAVIQTLFPEERYDDNTLDTPIIYGLWAQMQRAYEESKLKSERQKNVWIRKREKGANGSLITKACPNWLEPVDVVEDSRGRTVDGRYSIVDGARETISQIFELTLRGWSAYQIEKYLNENATWIPAKRRSRETGGWRVSYIRKILKSRSVIGEYVPRQVVTKSVEVGGYEEDVSYKEPMKDVVWNNYYPAVIDPELWHAVQKKLEPKMDIKRRNLGRTGNFGNIFRHLAKCGCCGGPLHFLNKYRADGAGMYLFCDSNRRKVRDSDTGDLVCQVGRIRYKDVRDVILNQLAQIEPKKVLPRPDEITLYCRDVRNKLDGIKNELSELKAKQVNLVDRISKTSNEEVGDLLEVELKKVLKMKKDLMVREEALNDQLIKAESRRESLEAWQTNLNELIKRIDGDDPSIRVSLNDHLKEFLDRIEIVRDGNTVAVTIYERISKLPKGERVHKWGDVKFVSPEPDLVEYQGRIYEITFISSELEALNIRE